MSEAFDLIYSYTRTQAIQDGVLIDVSEQAKEAGFRFPIAVTESLYQEYITPSDSLVKAGQSIEGRLWDVLSVLRVYASNTSNSTLLFPVLFQTSRTKTGEPVIREISLKALCHAGDNGEPVITIMFPEED